MFFKKLLFFSFVFCFSLASHANENFLSDIPCFKDMKAYFPLLIKGELVDWQKQKRFFRCLHDTLEIFVDKELFIPSEGRDYFTKEDVSWIFNVYFKYDPETSINLTNKLFFIKKALIGGSVNKLTKRELAVFRRLVDNDYDDNYKEIYFILHKQIPVFRKAFAGKQVTPKERTKALHQLKKAFILLKQAYTREKIVYPIHDLHKYDEYLEEAQILKPAEARSAEQSFWFLHNLYEGIFSPKKNIQGRDWQIALETLYNTVNLFLHHRAYFSKDMYSPAFVYRALESLEILVPSLQLVKTQNKTGFPLKNLDEMLSVVFSYQDSHTPGGFFANVNQTHFIPLFTRTLTCFSLNYSAEKSCNSEWGSRSSSSVVTLSFIDDKFEIFPDEIKRSSLSSQSAIIELEKLSILKQWLAAYKKSLSDIHLGNANSVAEKRQFNHWLHPFFGWEKDSSRIIFGSFHSSESKDKSYQLLNYQAFLSLLFSSYLPETFFSSENGTQSSSFSFETWKKMVKEVSPALVTLGGTEGYKASWRQSFFELFRFADTFSYSSNRDELLNARELVDLSVHLLEGIKSSYFSYNKVSPSCADKLSPSCVTQQIIEDEEIMAIHPRFQKNFLFTPSQIDKYKEKIEAILEEQGEPIQALSFTPLFILLQAMEINYDFIDTNQSFRLESDEILLFAQQFEELLAEKLPHLSNTDEARAYIMYSFKTGNMPFFTGDISTALRFENWYLDPKKRKAFEIFSTDFHFLIFDFYKLYQNF